MGLATCFLAANKAWGNVFDVDEAEATEEAAYHEKWPKGDYFVLDVQSHFTNGIPIGLRGEIGKTEFFRKMGFKLGESKDEASFRNFIRGDVLRQRNGHDRDRRRARPRGAA